MPKRKRNEGRYRNIKIQIDGEDRVYTGIAADGALVTLAPIDDPKTGSYSWEPMEEYLRDYPTPEDW
jgi:hypothetical protein